MRAIVAFFAFTALVFGQGFQGSLRGRVVDSSGAAVPLAKLTLTDQGTAISRSTITNDQGEYTFAAVTPSTYTVAAEASGFKQAVKKSVAIATQASVTLDIGLDIGQVSDTVNVVADSALIETADASTGQFIDRQKIEDLPNLGRNPFMLSKLSESVVQVGNPKFNRMQDQSGSSQIAIAGGPVRGNNYTLDGISITDSTNRAVIIPSQEAVQEMKVQANTYDAEMGRTGGGTFNTFLRSGTNAVHGSAFGYIRETDWIANNFFSNRAGQAKPEQPFKNYGGSFGGPIRIPKVYDGRNKTFFFVSGEAYRQYDASGTRLAVPTAIEKTGDFSKSVSTRGTQQLIYDPLSTLADGMRTAFPGNIIPANRINPIGLKLASFYPDPNVTSSIYGSPNFDATVRAFNRADQLTFKGDQEIKNWWRASASYLHYGSQEPSNRWFPNQVASPNQGVIFRKVDATQLNTTLTPSPTMVVAIRYGFNRFPNFTPPISLGFDLASLGLPASLVSQTKYPAFPSITMGDVASYGGGTTSQNVYYSRSFNGTISKFMGRHSLKAGADWRGLHHDGAPGIGPSSFGFSDVFTRASPRATTIGTGASLATMLLGNPTSGSQTVGTNFYNFVNYYGMFVQDDFRVTSKLTLNFGLRWEYETGPADKNNKFMIGFDPTAVSPLQANVPDLKLNGTLLYAGVNGKASATFNPSQTKFGPRAGIAWSPNTKTAFRGGFGIFWAPLPFSFQNTLGFSQSTPIITSIDSNFTPSASLSNPYPTGLLQPVGTSQGGLTGVGQAISIYDKNTRSAGYVEQYSFDMQRQLPASFVVSAGIIGSHSLHLVQDGRNIGQLDPSYLSLGTALNANVANPMYLKGGTLNVGNPTISRAQSLYPFPQFSSVALNSSDTNRASYFSLYVKVQRRFSSGMTVLATYTKARQTDLAYGTVANSFSTAPAGPQNAYDLNSEYGVSTSSTPNRLSTAVTYELPFGKGKRFLGSSRIADYALGGWSTNVVGVLQSGYPLAISQPNNNSVFGASAQRPNATGISPEVDLPFAKRIDGWINPAAFSQAPQFTFGNVSRTIGLRGPGTVSWDLSVFKSFQVPEGIKAQFRAEALNVTNTPQFYGPNTTFTNASFGLITSQANYPRLIQLGVRFTR
ncbi:MAG: carboxypeptidase regulatory-like protein [Bryobacterales bacterium]|nr:carboxypeptidase regulatory-like protein [Bryobacterales bacterium]